MKTIWDFMTVVAEEKSIIKAFEEKFMADKHNTINRAIWARNFINFVYSKTDQELEENEIKYRILYVVEINKMIVKNDCRNFIENKLIELKEAVNKFDKLFDKIARAGLLSCCGLGVGLLSWNSYEPLQVLAKSKVDSTHEKTQILKGATVINFL